MLDQILKSSTPDGLAPMSLMALSIITFCFAGISIIWGALNFLMLSRIGPQNQQEGQLLIGGSQTQEVRQMGFKILMGSLHYMKFNSVVILGATIIYFLLVLGAVQQWGNPSISISYILGVIGAFLCSFFTVVTSGFSYFRIVYSARYSPSDSFGAAKNASNSITFVSLGLIIASIMGLVMRFDPENKSDAQKINHQADVVLAYAFGFVTVGICTKVTSLIYSRGIQNSFQISSLFDMKGLKKDSRHPMVICKVIGETINKSLSKSLDFLIFIPAIVGIVMKAAGMNVIGTDQKGEIIFDLNSDNIYSSLLLFGFGLFFTILFSLWRGGPQNQAQVKTHFRINIAGITVFLCGFTALACYLTLPAEFQLAQFIKQDKQIVLSPLYAYLIVLIGMFVSMLISLSAQIKSSGLGNVYDLMKSCKTGPATCLISGLSKGYSYTFIPIVAIAPFGFLCYYWLGILGVGFGAVGIGLFIPYYMNANLYHSLMNSSSMIGFVSKDTQSSVSVESLLALSESKRSFQHKIFVYYNQVVALLAYTSIAVFAQYSQKQFSIEQPHLFSGLLIGAMTPYTFSALSIKGSYKVAPVICYDVQQQLEQNPGASKGKVELDFHRSNHLFILNCTLRILKFLPILIAPTLITGVLLSLQSIVGFMGGLTISAIQFSISSSMSGSLWRNVRDQIAYGKAKDEDNQDISIDSQWGKSAQVGNSVGSSMKQSIGQSAFIYVLWTIIMAVVFEDLYIRVHSE